MNLKKTIPALVGGLVLALAVSTPALAAYTNTGGAFQGFQDTVLDWAQGPLGIGLAVTMMLLGAGIGVAKNSPMPALSGVGAGAFLTWGPGIIVDLIGTGAMLPVAAMVI